jgi:site-specific recombinase XerD
VRLLDQVRERIRYKHYSIRTEESYVYWVRGFIRFHQLKHPKDMGSAEVTAFLSWLAAERGVAPSTHKQALSALLFLYREVLEIDLPWMNEILRPKDRVRVPTVLSVGEVARLFPQRWKDRWRCSHVALWHGASFDGGASPAGEGC